MALWGISTTTETAANKYAIPKFQHDVDRNRSPWNTFADCRGWIQRWYKTKENSGISTRYFDEVLVDVTGLNDINTGISSQFTGLGTAGPVAVFFEDPNLASPISVGGGGTTGIATNTVGYIGTGSTIGTTITAGLAATFSTRTVATKLFIDASRGFIGLVTDGSNGVGVISSFTQQFGDVLIRNIAGAGTTSGIGRGTTTLI